MKGTMKLVGVMEMFLTLIVVMAAQCMYECIHTYTHTSIYIPVHTYTYMNICIHIYIHMLKQIKLLQIRKLVVLQLYLSEVVKSHWLPFLSPMRSIFSNMWFLRVLFLIAPIKFISKNIQWSTELPFYCN